MKFFVDKNSIVRTIWGKSDTVLFIFAGSAAEFALNKAVDWLFFTGRLPADPLGRLFSTVVYAQKIVFGERDQTLKVIDHMAAMHKDVEATRGMSIPDWAYRDVLYMLIDYSIRSFELLERKLTLAEKQEVFDVFFRVGCRMAIKDLPRSFEQWQISREDHLNADIERSAYTIELYGQYKKHLGQLRYQILLSAQSILVPAQVKTGLQLRSSFLMKQLIKVYKLARLLRMDWYIKKMILPSEYISQVAAIEHQK